MTTEAFPQKQWTVSTSPHIRDRETTARIMWSVVLALAPAGVWAVVRFGWAAFYVMALSVATCALTEAVCQKMRGRRVTLFDGSAVVTGLLLAYVLPSHSLIAANGEITGIRPLAWYVVVVGAVVAVAIGKHAFGGLGFNIWNPALVGRAFAQISFATHVSPPQWPFPTGEVDAVTKATALVKGGQTAYTLKELFLGLCPGSLGEVSGLLLLIGGIYLIVSRYVDWRLPLGYLLSVVALATLLAWSPSVRMPGWTQAFAQDFVNFRGGQLAFGAFLKQWLTFGGMEIFAGGVMLGAFFMATDMVTSPYSHKGQLIFGIGCGVLTVLFRFYSGMPEGVCYSILIMNTVRPYIDMWTRQRVMGAPK